MAQLTQPTAPDDEVEGVLSLTIRPWTTAAVRPEVGFALGECYVEARSVVWTEIILAVNATPIHYSRQPLQLGYWNLTEPSAALLRGREKVVTWLSDCPYARFELRRAGTDATGTPLFRADLFLDYASLLGANGSPGLTFTIDRLTAVAVAQFAADLDGELQAVYAGQLPDLTAVQPGYDVYPVARALNAYAYDAIGAQYTQDYLADPFVQSAFGAFCASQPVHAQVLDVGCGHGLPVTQALAAHGFAVTGIDVSTGMLALARRNVPAADFVNLAAADLDGVNQYDGICAFYALLCLDPIELRVALQRLAQALRPGGWVFVVSGVPDANMRLSPFARFHGQTTWEWRYDLEDLLAIIAQEPRLTVVDAQRDLRTTNGAILAPAQAADWVTTPPECYVYTLLLRKQGKS